MLQTLKIARLAAAIAAVAFIAFLAFSGFKPDKARQEVIDKPSAVDKFKKLALNTNRSKTKESPLVTEAKAFAFRIDPPPPVVAKSVAKKEPVELKIPEVDRPAPPKVVKNSKFKLLATCRYENTPEKSLALLKIVAVGHKWVRQGETIGHLTIHEVKDGSIVLYQGDQEHSEIVVPAIRVATKSLIKVKGDGLADARTISPSNSGVVTPSGRRTAPAPSNTSITRSRQVGATPRRTVQVRKRKPEPTPEEMEAELNSNIAGIEKLMADTIKESSTDSKEEINALSEFLKMLQKDKEELKNKPAKGANKPASGTKIAPKDLEALKALEALGTPKAPIKKADKNTK